MAAIPKPARVLVFHHTDETAKLEEIGTDVDLESCEEKYITFYSVDFVGPYKVGPITYTNIGSGSTMFISPWSEDRVNAALQGENHDLKV